MLPECPIMILPMNPRLTVADGSWARGEPISECHGREANPHRTWMPYAHHVLARHPLVPGRYFVLAMPEHRDARIKHLRSVRYNSG
jgi:hypothetical protein